MKPSIPQLKSLHNPRRTCFWGPRKLRKPRNLKSSTSLLRLFTGPGAENRSKHERSVSIGTTSDAHANVSSASVFQGFLLTILSRSSPNYRRGIGKLMKRNNAGPNPSLQEARPGGRRIYRKRYFLYRPVGRTQTPLIGAARGIFHRPFLRIWKYLRAVRLLMFLALIGAIGHGPHGINVRHVVPLISRPLRDISGMHNLGLRAESNSCGRFRVLVRLGIDFGLAKGVH